MRAAVLMGALAALSACHASTPHEDDHPTPAAAPATMTAAQQAYAAVNDRMHAAMGDIPADADVAFMHGMLAHHRGAVEMAEIELEHGADAQARDLARRVMEAQRAEIAEMETWLKARGAPTTGTLVDHAGMGH